MLIKIELRIYPRWLYVVFCAMSGFVCVCLLDFLYLQYIESNQVNGLSFNFEIFYFTFDWRRLTIALLFVYFYIWSTVSLHYKNKMKVIEDVRRVPHSHPPHLLLPWFVWRSFLLRVCVCLCVQNSGYSTAQPSFPIFPIHLLPSSSIRTIEIYNGMLCHCSMINSSWATVSVWQQ